MGKKLVIDTMFCDLRKMQESTLAQYDSIRISAMIVMTNARARELMSRYPFEMDCMHTLDLDDETTLNTLNGKTLFTGRNTPNGRQYLVVNGMMTITPDAGDALRQYMGMMINGMVYCPDSWPPSWPARPPSTARWRPTPTERWCCGATPSSTAPLPCGPSRAAFTGPPSG